MFPVKGQDVVGQVEAEVQGTFMDPDGQKTLGVDALIEQCLGADIVLAVGRPALNRVEDDTVGQERGKPIGIFEQGGRQG